MAGSRVDEKLVDGRYALKEQVGRGGFGVVWRAHDTLLRRDVAIKEVHVPSILDDDERAALRDKVLREARAAARMSHPALVTVFDVVEEDERPLIVMELVDAPTLAERVEADGPLSDPEAARIGQEILDALATAHSHGIVHRDVKPANVMVSDTGRVQLGDFGIASLLDDPKVTSSGKLAGSPSYMAPEQAHNRPAGAATDLWGLGATLYYAVEGAPPFEKEGALATLTSVVADEPRPMERATTLAPLLNDLLAKDPAARPPVGDVRRRLADIAAGDVAAAPSPTMELDAGLLEQAAVATNEAARTEAEPVDGEPIEAAAPPPPPPPPPAAAPEPPPPRPAPPSPAPRQAPAAARPRPRPSASRTPGVVPVVFATVAVVALLAVLLSRIGGTDTPPAEDAAGPSTTTEAEPQTGGGPGSTSGSSAGSGSSGRVPSSWVSYQDPATGYTIRHPADWSVSTSGTLTDFRDPSTGAYLRVDYTRSPGPSAEQAWLDYEPTFAAENPNYRRLRIEPTTFQGHPAAIWEFTYTGRGTPLRAVDLGFVTGPFGFALNFQAPADRWADMQDEFEAFKASFRIPSG